MLTVLVFFGTLVLGVVAIGILEPTLRHLLKPLGVPGDVIQAVFIAAGALVVLPFVLAVLAEANVSIVASLIVGAVLLLHAAGAFGYAMLRLAMPLVRVPYSKKR
jgi:hypothetical protein